MDEDGLRQRLPDAVARARRRFTDRRKAFEDHINAKLNGEMAALEDLKHRQHARIEEMLATSRQAEKLKERRAAEQRQEVKDIFGDYLDWIQETMTTEEQPWVKVICVLTGDGEANAAP